MPEQPFDPVAIWRDMLSRWEKTFSEIADRNLDSPDFSKVFNQMLGMSVHMQQAMAELMSRTLMAMNIPSRADLVAINERLQSIEQQLAQSSPPASSKKGTAGRNRGASATARRNKSHRAAARPLAAPEALADATQEGVSAAPARAAKPARRTKKQGKSS
jgi:hypothetical protein